MPSLIQSTPPIASIGLLADLTGVAGALGAIMPDLSAAIASAVLRSLGEDTHTRSVRRRERVLGALACASVGIVALTTTGLSLVALAACLLCLPLLVAADIDRRHHLLPDQITIPLLWLGLLLNLGAIVTPLNDAVIGAVTGYLGLRTLSWGVAAASRSEGIGHGDFKLVAALGAWLGWQALPAILFIAAALAVLTGLLHAASTRARTLPRLAFGPSLAAAGIFVLFVPSLRHW
ncbi:A24 family peptidase [Paraburkholderia sp. A2WS-5]|uniref:prepilin peptidase n=1 Tax=unclassified Paraburkholderia TaxID=2615204 RepID=UPI003B767719